MVSKPGDLLLWTWSLPPQSILVCSQIQNSLKPICFSFCGNFITLYGWLIHWSLVTNPTFIPLSFLEVTKWDWKLQPLITGLVVLATSPNSEALRHQTAHWWAIRLHYGGSKSFKSCVPGNRDEGSNVYHLL